MKKEDMYMLGCLHAVNRLIERGGVNFKIRVDGKLEIVPLTEIKEWIEKQYGIEQEVEK
jgi:ribosomal protein S24E